MRILGLETSCDETAVALYDSHQGLLSHHIYSQIPLHIPYGGVVPELASRDHIRRTLPLVMQVLEEAGLAKHEIDAIAYTKGPGLIGGLMVGAVLAKSMAYALRIPIIGVHHMESHLMAVHLESDSPEYPFIALLVSGGHTMLVQVHQAGRYTILGESVDDAVGEAFDKTAKLLGLPYPGGPALSKLAEKGNPARFRFPRPLYHRSGFNFSFSGLKTHALKCLEQHRELNDPSLYADIARAFEEAVVDVLVAKSMRALTSCELTCLVVVGGVASNQRLRSRFIDTVYQQGGRVYFPRPLFCTDNGAMVAYNGYLHIQRGKQEEGTSITVKSRWSMEDLS